MGIDMNSIIFFILVTFGKVFGRSWCIVFGATCL